LLAEAGLILMPDLDLFAGVRFRDRLDLIDDHLLEDRLEFRIGVLVLGSGHEAAVVEAIQELVDPVEAVAGAELLLQDAADVGAPQGADAVLGARRGINPLEETALLGAGQDRCPAGMGAVGQRLQAAAVVRRDPGLDGAAADAQGAGDVGCGVALLGQGDRLHAGPGAGLAALLGRLV
jgi:hypothetical protein